MLDFIDFKTTNIQTYTDDVFKYTRPINAVLDFTDYKYLNSTNYLKRM